MSVGPIDFGGTPGQDVPSTEYGGADGLIQPENAQELRGDPEASGGHTLDSDKRQALSENARIMARRASTPLVGIEQLGEDGGAVWPVEVIDPVTGRVVPEDKNQESSGEPGELSDLKPQ